MGRVRLKKTFQISAIAILILFFGVLFYYRYDQDRRAYLQHRYCQNIISYQKVSQQLEDFPAILSENIYLEETFDQKVLPQIKDFFVQGLRPQISNRATADLQFKQGLQKDQAAIENTKNIQDLLKTLETKAQSCERIIFVEGVFSPRYLFDPYPQEPKIDQSTLEWKKMLSDLRPLAVQVKKQIELDFQTLCQAWRNLFQAQQISRYFDLQCRRPQGKKKCSAEQNEKLKQFASEQEEQYSTNFSKFKKKWAKIPLTNEEVTRKCL